MNGKDLLNGLNYIDDNFILEADTGKINKPVLKFILPIAAAFGIAFTGYLQWQNIQGNNHIKPNINPPIISSEPINTKKDYNIHFNRASNAMARSVVIEGHFWAKLNQEQKEKLLPTIANKYKAEAVVHYSHTDTATSIFSIDGSFTVDNHKFRVTISPKEIAKCYIIEGKPILSEIDGIEIDAGIFVTDKNSRGEQNYIYYADFKIDDIAYYLEFSADKNQEDLFTDILADIILGGKADLSLLENPTVPKLLNQNLTEKEIYTEKDFGMFMPKVPSGYAYNQGTRFINQGSNYLSASWSSNYNYVRFVVRNLEDTDKKRIVSLYDTTLYDMSLYPIPWVDSMPKDNREIIENPIFKAEDLTLEAVKMREYIRGEQGEPSGNSINLRFSVLFNDVLVEINSEGLTSEYIYNEILRIAKQVDS